MCTNVWHIFVHMYIYMYMSSSPVVIIVPLFLLIQKMHTVQEEKKQEGSAGGWPLLDAAAKAVLCSVAVLCFVIRISQRGQYCKSS